jgi:hypothetical protein
LVYLCAIDQAREVRLGQKKERVRRTMHKMIGMAFCIATFAMNATAQTTASYLETSPAVPVTAQGPYVSWNNLTGSTGETDFINNRGYGGGGFAFMNTPYTGSPLSTLMFINGSGNVGIGTTSPISALTLAGSGSLNPNTGSQLDYPGESLTFVDNTSGANYELGGIRIVQPTGYYLDRGNMVFTIGTGSLGTLDAVTIQSPTGNVGIGTTSPAATLDVAGNMKLSGNGASLTFADGTVQSTAWNGTLSGGDYAESVDVTGARAQYEPGDVMVIDPDTPGKFLKSAEPYSTAVAGIYSTKPGMVGRRQTAVDPQARTMEVPMAMVGIVPTKVSAENGPIKPGDTLVTSSTIGHAMKATDRSLFASAVVGKALGSLDSGTGVIEVLVSLQ